jgi:uncharacterized protein (TIGR03000 family)
MNRRGVSLFATLALVGAAFLLTPQTSQARPWGWGGGYYGGYYGYGYRPYYSGYYGYGYSPYFSSYYSMPYYSSYYYPSYGYSSYYYPSYGYSSYYHPGYSYSYAYPTYSYSYSYPTSGYYPYYSYSVQPRVVSTPLVYNSSDINAPRVANTTTSSSNYAPADDTAHVNVKVPAGAQLWFNDKQTQQTGTDRTFETPPLKPGQKYTYDVKAQWKENGQTMTKTRTISVTAGANVNVDFEKESGSK